jgi:hypothetical protein
VEHMPSGASESGLPVTETPAEPDRFRAGPASLAESAAQATKLIMRSYGPVLAEGAATELEPAVLALVQAAATLRAYPLRNSDEPMTVNGRGPGEPWVAG